MKISVITVCFNSEKTIDNRGILNTKFIQNSLDNHLDKNDPGYPGLSRGHCVGG